MALLLSYIFTGASRRAPSVAEACGPEHAEVADCLDGIGSAEGTKKEADQCRERAATRGNTSPRNSAVAVQFAEDFFPELVTWLEGQAAVKKAAATQ